MVLMLPGCGRTVCSLAYFKYINVVFLWTIIWLLESAKDELGLMHALLSAPALGYLHAVQKVQMAPELGNCLIAAG